MATTYGLLHQPAPQTSAGAQAPTIAAKDNKADAGSAGINAATKEQAARKDDGLITGSLPKKQDITAPAADAKTAPQAAKKKPATATAKTETQKNLFDFFNNGQPRR